MRLISRPVRSGAATPGQVAGEVFETGPEADVVRGRAALEDHQQVAGGEAYQGGSGDQGHGGVGVLHAGCGDEQQAAEKGDGYDPLAGPGFVPTEGGQAVGDPARPDGLAGSKYE